MSTNPFLAETLGDDPGRLAAAFRLGHRVYEYRIWQVTNRVLADGLMDGPPDAPLLSVVDELEEARLNLAGAIHPNVFATLPEVFEHLRARAKDFVNGIETESSYPGAWLGPTPTPESPCWSRLNCLVRQSLPAGGDLQRLLELGLAFGRLELAAYQNVGETVPAQPPEEQPPALAGGVLRAVAVVPSRVVGAVPALQTLQRLSAEFDASAPACTFTNAVGI